MQTRPSKDWAFSVVQASECLRCKDDALPLFFATGRRIQQIVNWLFGLIMNPPGAVCQLRRGRVCQSRRERIALKPQPLRIYTYNFNIRLKRLQHFKTISLYVIVLSQSVSLTFRSSHLTIRGERIIENRHFHKICWTRRRLHQTPG